MPNWSGAGSVGKFAYEANIDLRTHDDKRISYSDYVKQRKQ